MKRNQLQLAIEKLSKKKPYKKHNIKFGEESLELYDAINNYLHLNQSYEEVKKEMMDVINTIEITLCSIDKNINEMVIDYKNESISDINLIELGKNSYENSLLIYKYIGKNYDVKYIYKIQEEMIKSYIAINKLLTDKEKEEMLDFRIRQVEKHI